VDSSRAAGRRIAAVRRVERAETQTIEQLRVCVSARSMRRIIGRLCRPTCGAR